ncbi:hypothetical protein SLS58_010402 [Diplodia intermedia]|uniref:Uncharacterized protein n=1 Tax=Diplodia intermedia TaxID=856260 RepID=A0ABR3T6T4_9PEZI
MAALGRRLSKRLSMFSTKRRSTAESVVSYSSLSTSLSEVPAENNECFDKDLWLTAQMDKKDPRLDLPRGGLPKPDQEWYDALDEDTSTWAPDVFYRGLDISIREYLEAEADLVELLHDVDEDGVPWCTKEWTYTVSVRTRYIHDRLRASYDWLSDEECLQRRGVPSWFVEDGLSGWMESRARQMRENPDFCKYIRTEPRAWVARTQDKRIDSFHADLDEKQQAQQGLQRYQDVPDAQLSEKHDEY